MIVADISHCLTFDKLPSPLPYIPPTMCNIQCIITKINLLIQSTLCSFFLDKKYQPILVKPTFFFSVNKSSGSGIEVWCRKIFKVEHKYKSLKSRIYFLMHLSWPGLCGTQYDKIWNYRWAKWMQQLSVPLVSPDKNAEYTKQNNDVSTHI